MSHGLVAANVLAWVFLQGLGRSPLSSSVCRLGLIPGELLQTPAAGTAVPLGRGHAACVIQGEPTGTPR